MDLRALIFLPALVGSVVLGFVFLLYVASYFLAVLEGTAAGARQIPWQAEAITDNFAKLVYLGWLLGIWAGPAYLIARAAAPAEPWLRLAVPLLVMWLLYPVGQLASLSAHSPWVPLNADVLARIAQKPVVTAGFYALTLPVYVLFGFAFHWAYLTAGKWHLLFVGVPLLSLAVLLNARLLGRLAFALRFTQDVFARKRPRTRRKERPRDRDAEPSSSGAVQPRELPPVNTPDGGLTGYDVLISDDLPAPRKRVIAVVADEDDAPASKRAEIKPEPDAGSRVSDDDEDRNPYGVRPAEGESVLGERPAKGLVQPKADELALLDRRDVPKLPKRVWTGEVLAFLGQPGTISAFLVLTALGTFTGVMVRAARAFDPTAGGD